MTTSHPLPRWDMTAVYPGLETPTFEEGFDRTVQDIADLVDLFDTYAIGEKPSQAVETAIVQVFETITTHYNRVQESTRTLTAYINSFILTDSAE